MPNVGSRNLPGRGTVTPETDRMSRWIPKTESTGGESLATASAAPKPVPQPADIRPISIAATFPRGPDDKESDEVLVLSSNHVYFAVQSYKLLTASANRFCHRLPVRVNDRRAASREDEPYVLTLPDDSAVLNIVFHIIYGLSFAHCSPSLTDLAAVIDVLKTYAIRSARHLAPGGSIYTFVLAQASTRHTAEAFAFTVEHKLEQLAVAISPLMLMNHELDRISDALASRIGGVYLLRLHRLRQKRYDAMRMLMKAPLFLHAPDPQCTLADRQEVTCNWLFEAANLVWNFGAALSPGQIKGRMCTLRTDVCSECRESLAQQINEIVAKWTLVAETI